MSPVHTRTKGLPFHPLYYDGGDGDGHSDDHNNNGSDHNNNNNNSNENVGGTLKSRSVGRIGHSGRNSSSKRPPPKDQPTLRRSSRKRTMHVMLDYESETDGEDDYHLRRRPFRMSRSRKSHPKSNPDEHNDGIPIIPRREGLRPRQGAQVARQDYSQDSEEEEDEQVLLSSPSEDEADREGGDADGTERAGREDEEFEEREGCRRYALRNRTEIQRFSPRMEDKPMPKPFHIKRNRDGKRRSDKRHRSSKADDSDDSLLIDEMAQVPGGASFLKAGSFNQQILFGGLDLSGFSNRSLNIAATGWGHQSDNWSGATAGGASGAQTTAGLSHKGGADIQPIQVDDSLGFDQVGGLSHYTQALKEMVFFPLLYPKFFDNYGITPPRGVLLCGPPGTGKTLVARALAASASRAGQRVSFYMRKGADVLSKWVGEAERQLRMLFEEAQRNQPSIIFFDEIDGLAPVRSSKQEQIHNSIVSTLLALMDGLDSRGQVVVIGATNRVDAIDGALRRPGRFDRELIFSLPDSKAREEILEIHTRKWQDPPSEEVRKELAAVCVGYCGADLKALCTEAAIRAFRKKYPQVYNSDEQLLIDADSVKVKKRDFLEVMSTITPAAQRGALVQSMPLSVTVLPLLENQLKKIMDIVTEIFPMSKSEDCLSIPDDENNDSFDQLAMFSTLQHGSAFPFVYKPRLLLSGKEGAGLEHMGPAVLHELERFPMHSLSLPCLLSDMGSRNSEEALVNIFREAKRTTPSVLYLPQLDLWWDTAHKQLQTVLLMLLNELPSSLPVLLLGTTKVPQFDLDEQARSVFLGRIYELGPPKADDRAIFFSQLVDTVLAMNDQKGHSKEKQEIFPELAKAPKKERSPTEAELRAQAEEEEHALRRLRMCLREVCNRLLYEKCFGTFHYPVLEEDAPDYHSIVKSPMDVATLLQRVDAGHYMTRSAFLQDLELIPINAKVYHGDDYNGARIVSKALALRDAAHGMLSQMDKELVCECDAIADRGGPIKCPASNGQMHSSALGQSGNVTRASARLRGFQPEIDLSQMQEIHHRRTRRNSDGEHTGGDAATAVMGTSGGDHNIASSLKMRELNSNTEEVPSKEVAFSVPQGEVVVVSQGTDSSSQLYKEQSSQRRSSLVHLIDPHTITSMENGHPVGNSEAAEQVQTYHRGEHSHEARFDNDSFSKGVDKIKKRFVKYTRGYEVSQLEQVHARVCQTIRSRAGGSGRASLLEMLEKFVSDMNTGKFELEHEAEADC